jgi:rhodanese-related sulfurtransferase
MLDYQISPADAARLIKAQPVRLIDVRQPWEYATAHIEGSLLMPIEELAERALRELDPAERLIVVCHHGVRSMNATAWLRRQGFAAAQSLAGGIEAWSLEIDPAVGRY